MNRINNLLPYKEFNRINTYKAGNKNHNLDSTKPARKPSLEKMSFDSQFLDYEALIGGLMTLRNGDYKTSLYHLSGKKEAEDFIRNLEQVKEELSQEIFSSASLGEGVSLEDCFKKVSDLIDSILKEIDREVVSVLRESGSLPFDERSLRDGADDYFLEKLREARNKSLGEMDRDTVYRLDPSSDRVVEKLNYNKKFKNDMNTLKSLLGK